MSTLQIALYAYVFCFGFAAVYVWTETKAKFKHRTYGDVIECVIAGIVSPFFILFLAAEKTEFMWKAAWYRIKDKPLFPNK